MTSILKADTIQDAAGNNIINENANTITIGASGDTIIIPSGATITNSLAHRYTRAVGRMAHRESSGSHGATSAIPGQYHQKPNGIIDNIYWFTSYR